MISKAVAHKAIETMADYSRQMIKFMDVSSTCHNDIIIAIKQINIAEQSMKFLLEQADI